MQSTHIDKTSLVQEIQNILNFWINEKPDTRSIACIARETGVSDSAIRRLMNNSVKITDDSIFKILSYVLDQHTFDGITHSLAFKPEALKWFTKNYSYLKSAPALSNYRHSPTTDEVALSAISYSVYNVVLALKSVPAGYIKEQFGMRGEIELENLLKKGILFQEEDKICIKSDSLVKFTKEQVVHLLPEVTKTFFKADHDFNARSFEVGAVSKKGYINIMDTYEVFLNQISKIYVDHPGDIPVIVAGFFDSLTTQPYFEGGKSETPN